MRSKIWSELWNSRCGLKSGLGSARRSARSRSRSEVCPIIRCKGFPKIWANGLFYDPVEAWQNVWRGMCSKRWPRPKVGQNLVEDFAPRCDARA
eukprot:8363941-Pyramimonas_sp.AAC.1